MPLRFPARGIPYACMSWLTGTFDCHLTPVRCARCPLTQQTSSMPCFWTSCICRCPPQPSCEALQGALCQHTVYAKQAAGVQAVIPVC